jgi:hypothetical protein
VECGHFSTPSRPGVSGDIIIIIFVVVLFVVG